MNDLAFHTSCQVRPCQDIPPLVVSTHPEAAIVGLEQVPEIVCLQQHVLEFDEIDPGLESDLVALRGQHSVYAKVSANISQKIYVAEAGQPISIIHHNRLSVPKLDEPG